MRQLTYTVYSNPSLDRASSFAPSLHGGFFKLTLYQYVSPYRGCVTTDISVYGTSTVHFT